MKRLLELKAAGEEVAVVLADQWMSGITRVGSLAYARQLYPTAKRVLLIVRGDKKGRVVPGN